MLRSIRELIGLGLFIGGLVILAFATVGHVGYALYLWADNVVLATALWTAFKSWILFIIAGFTSVIIGKVLVY